MEKTFSIASTQPAKLIIAAPDGRVAAEISGDGVLAFGDGFGATEAAEAFVAAVRGLLPVEQLTVAPAADATRQTLAHTLRDHEPDQSLTDDEYWLAEADNVLKSPWMAAHDAMMLEGKDYQLRRANRIRQNQSAEIERLRQYAPTPAMEALLARSSIGTDEAVAARESVSVDAGRAVVRLGEVMRERDEARAVLGAVAPLADGEWSESDRRDVAAWLIREADQRVKFFPQRRDGVDALMRTLAGLVLAPVSGAVAKPDDVTRWDQIADNWTVSAGERFRAEYARETDDAIELTATDEMAGVPVRDLFRGAADSYYTARADALTEENVDSEVTP